MITEIMINGFSGRGRCYGVEVEKWNIQKWKSNGYFFCLMSARMWILEVLLKEDGPIYIENIRGGTASKVFHVEVEYSPCLL